mmetsp:Transcript_17844/g.33289  ORF Transcript_17844/g.33289 Transcript_17844/m.33289 type:complete len:367 (+) Transcript_17844:127-1227(+)
MSSTNAPASSVVVARLFLPDDANIAGNVHGGTTLKLMEEAGMIAATRHMSTSEASKASDGNCLAALVRFEHMAFHKPVSVGELGSCKCEIIFTSNQSILVEVMVTAENISKGKTRVTNTGWLWYVPMAPSSVDGTGKRVDWKPVQVLPVPIPDGEDDDALKKYEKAKEMYEKRKSNGNNDCDEAGESTPACATEEGNNKFDTFKNQYTTPSDGHSPAESEQVLCQMVLPGDCGVGDIAFGGFVMKMMDNAAGCSAFRHCRTNIVTVAISDLDFQSWVKLGDLCTVRSKVVFASSKSLDIEVVASAASFGEDTVVAKGLFTFVSIGSDGRAKNVPKLRLESEEDMQKAHMGKQRYEAAKAARLAGKR